MARLTMTNGLLAKVTARFWPNLLSQKMTYFRLARFVVGVFVSAKQERLALVYPENRENVPTPEEMHEIIGRAAHYNPRRIYKAHQLPFPVEGLRDIDVFYLTKVKSLDQTPVTVLFPVFGRSVNDVECSIGFYETANCSHVMDREIIDESTEHLVLYRNYGAGHLTVCLVGHDSEFIGLLPSVMVAFKHGRLLTFPTVTAANLIS